MKPNVGNQKKTIRRLVLIDDDSTDNFLHSRLLQRSGLVDDLIIFEEAEEALKYICSSMEPVDVICLDINMPRMNGFEFLDAFESSWDPQLEKPLIVILSTTVGPAEIEYAKRIPRIVGAETKPLRPELIEFLAERFFVAE
ncbi:response regulator [Rubripirellula reticaptiva]|uniref:Response regulator of RpoS n=1 Tax=Rubripirellula reticaptiva TaxID=2528013 RepID=A0A5C6EBG4_9BACT|nr:response regulator [Rubripirellula reticaptiva]TWU47103.1 response regulator of RpoS [Rubripirellula reticaptiva]